MFSHEGDARTAHQNRRLAAYLALVAGFANSAGFVLLGTFTSHVTGNVGRLADDASTGHLGAAFSALSLVLSFYFGAFFVSMLLESRSFGHISRAYASALAIEALLLGSFALLGYFVHADHARVLDAEAALLCVAMGMQNGLVTRISSAVVRTTHLTGVVTDLGIESARWVRHRRMMGAHPRTAPDPIKMRLLATVGLAFLCGALGGAFAAPRLGHAVMILPVVAITFCSLFAVRNGRAHEAELAQLSRR